MKGIAAALVVLAGALSHAAASEPDGPALGEEEPNATPARDKAPRPDAPDATAAGQAAAGQAAEAAPSPAQEAPREDDAARDVFVPSEDISEDLSVRFPVDI